MNIYVEPFSVHIYRQFACARRSRLKVGRYVLMRLKVNRELRNEGCYPKRRALGCATHTRDQYKHASPSGPCMCQSVRNGA